MDFLLLSQYAPNNVAHVVSLVDSGFYNGLEFFRIISDFMEQAGRSHQQRAGRQQPEHRWTTSSAPPAVRFDRPAGDGQQRSGHERQPVLHHERAYPSLDFGYTIIGDLVSGDSLRQAISNVPVEANSSGEDSQPLNPPIIDSITVVPDTQYGLVMLKPGSSATDGETATVGITASDSSSVTLTASDGSSQPSLSVEMAHLHAVNERPSRLHQHRAGRHDNDEHAGHVFHSRDPGRPGRCPSVRLAGSLQHKRPYDRQLRLRHDRHHGTATVTPSNNLLGVYNVILAVWRSGTDPSSGSPYDSQHVAVYISPTAPAALSSVYSGEQRGRPSCTPDCVQRHRGDLPACRWAFSPTAARRPSAPRPPPPTARPTITTDVALGRRLPHLHRRATIRLRRHESG